MKIRKLIISLVVGTFLSLILITSTDISTYGQGFKPLIPYIGMATLGGILISISKYHGEEIENLKKELDKLKKEV